MKERPAVSVVVPVYNEAESLPPLHAELVAVLDEGTLPYEIVFVDDGSRDGSREVLERLRSADPRVRVVRLRRNFGQTAALAAGFDRAAGEIVVAIDADLQNDPRDIPRLLGALGEGADVATGWRRPRRDAWLTRRLPSALANGLLRALTGIPVHDSGCTLKAYRAPVLRRLPLYGEMHRYLPVLSATVGARIVEVEVRHRPRRFGRSKYGMGRVLRVVLDLLTVNLLVQFTARPLHWFGLAGLPFFLGSVGFVLLGILGGARLREEGSVVFASVSVLFLLAALNLVLLGLLAELAVKAGRRGVVPEGIRSERE